MPVGIARGQGGKLVEGVSQNKGRGKVSLFKTWRTSPRLALTRQ